MTNRLMALALCGLGTSFALASSTAAAQNARPAINLGQAVGIRLENSANHDGPRGVGQVKLVVNTLLDTFNRGPFILTIEQGGHALATATCEADAVVYSGDRQEGLGMLRECATNDFPAASLRTNAPADVVLAVVNDATDERTEIYRGTFPVIGFTDWEGNDDSGRPMHIEQRALRLDSFYGVGFVHQSMASELEFSYVTTQNTGDLPTESAMRCRVGTGEWQVYETSVSDGSEQRARNRVWVGSSVREDGPETIVWKYVRFSSRMPIAIAGGNTPPSAGDSMDGAWTCEFRWGGAGTRVVAREFRFNVQGGNIQPNAIESQIAPGRAAALLSVGFNPAAMPAIFDPAIVNGTVAGRRLTGATAPVVAGMPARATNPAFTAPRGR